MPAGSAKLKSAEGGAGATSKNTVPEGEEDLFTGQRDHLEVNEESIERSPLMNERVLLDNGENVDAEIARYFEGIEGVKGLSAKEINDIGRAIYQYSGPFDYDRIRAVAKSWIDTGDYDKGKERYFNQFKNVEKFIARAPKMPKGTVVYRGVGSSRVFYDIMNTPIGGEYRLKAPTSTSTTQRVADKFMEGNNKRAGDNYKVMMTIKGAAQKTGASIKTLAASPDQNEVLLSGRTVLKKVGQRVETKGGVKIMHVEFEYARSDPKFTKLTK
jgi:hypothetical protein